MKGVCLRISLCVEVINVSVRGGGGVSTVSHAPSVREAECTCGTGFGWRGG